MRRIITFLLAAVFLCVSAQCQSIEAFVSGTLKQYPKRGYSTSISRVFKTIWVQNIW